MLIEGMETTTFLMLSLALSITCIFLAIVWGWFKGHQLKGIQLQLDEKHAEITACNMEVQQAQKDLHQQLNSRDMNITKLNTIVDQQRSQLQDNQKKLEKFELLKERYIEIQAKTEEKEHQLKEKETMLQEAKLTLFKEFELTANKLFEEKKESFNQTSKQNIEDVLIPFKQQLNNFNKQVEQVYYKENTQRNQLIGQIGELQRQTQKISEDANNLASALKGDNRAQGNWGEVILERLLEQSGLVKGREYFVQEIYRNDRGKVYRPDVVVHLPNEKDIVVDSKMVLVEYERFASEPDKELQNQHLKKHIDAIRTHIKSLSFKEYQDLQGIRTLDFVFMFIPIEAAYITAIHHSPSLFDEAYEKKIMLVSPSSLMVALRTVETMWRYEKQNTNAEKIALSAGKLYDQFVLFMTALEDIGGYIQKANESHELAIKRLSNGRGNILKRIEDLKKLGIKPSKALSQTSQNALEQESMKVESDVLNALVLEEKK